jgi:hypothetical protein
MAKTHRKRDHEPHMRPRERMHGLFIGLIFPQHGKCVFFVALEIRSGYRRGEEMFAYLS